MISRHSVISDSANFFISAGVPAIGMAPCALKLSFSRADDVAVAISLLILAITKAGVDDGTAIDHVGIFLGRDDVGNDRFISSRKTANGPTMGDLAGRSVLNGTGYYASAFRTARRV